MSKLEEGQYPIVIGFPGNQWPSQNFEINVKDNDRGFAIKNKETTSFGLIDLQTAEPVLAFADKNDEQVKGINKEKKTDEFSRILALVTDNPTILEGDRSDENDAVVKSRNQSSQSIIKIFSKKETSGFTWKYLVKDGSKNDTINVVIPIENKKNSKVSKLSKTECKQTASDADFIQLRRLMTAEDNENKMIAVAKASFKERCYNADQIKYLSALFIDEEERIVFMEAAYPSVIDKMNFSSLQTMLTLEKNKSRFKTLIQP